MANELNIKIQLTYTPSATNQVSVSPPFVNQTISMTGDKYVSHIQTIPNGGENLETGEITSEGVLMVKNLDASDFVLIGAGGTATVRVNAGETFVFRINPSATIVASTGSGDVDIQYWLFDA